MQRATVGQVAEYMEELAPLGWAESWDNVGLQVGDPRRPVERILVALELTGGVVEEAVQAQASLVVVHHPPIFKPLKAVRFDSPAGVRLERLIQCGISVYAAHTNLDQAQGGTNDTLAALVGLQQPSVLMQLGEEPYTGRPRGHGRIGQLGQPVTLGALAGRLKEMFGLQGVRIVGDLACTVKTVAVGAGSGGDLVPIAAGRGADVLVTGDVKYHDAQDAADAGLCIIDIGHYASEQIVVPPLAQYLRTKLAAGGFLAQVTEGQAGRDPFVFL